MDGMPDIAGQVAAAYNRNAGRTGTRFTKDPGGGNVYTLGRVPRPVTRAAPRTSRSTRRSARK